MSAWLLHFAVGNLCVASLLAVAAWTAQRHLRQPMLAHLLWLLVLAKLLTPPLFTLPLLPLGEAQTEHALPLAPAGIELPAVDVAAAASPITFEAVGNWLLTAWLIGSIVVLVCSLTRIVRFRRALHQASRPAPAWLQQIANELAPRLGLRKTPNICTTSARISPMVFWLGGPVRIYVPTELLQAIPQQQLRWVVAHELAHVSRRDHVVRWLEWLACVAFWWNPVAWWARRNLRINEEVCCDAFVLRSLQPKPRIYANSLLSVVEFLASPTLRPPAMASEINSGGFLERRLKMIVSKNRILTTPRWLQAALLLFTVGVLPLGVAYAQDPDVHAVGTRLKKAVAAGELTADQARAMMKALQRNSTDEQRARDAETRQLDRKRDMHERLVQLQDRLDASIEKGDLTKKEARDVLRKAQDKMKDHKNREAREAVRREYDMRKIEAREVRRKRSEIDEEAARLHDLTAELENQVNENELAREQVRIKIEAVRREHDMRRIEAREIRRKRSEIDEEAARLHDITAELENRVIESELAREQGRIKIEAVRRDIDKRTAELHEQDLLRHNAEQEAANMAAAAAKLKQAVREGKLTKEQANKKWQAMSDKAAKKAKSKDKKSKQSKGKRRRSKRRSGIR